ncbi:HD domain-containing protein [Cytophaga aurantiaca]|uniref:HD domain-containing protein n=1 Tax=Cytophaga aurantiaca TaxID=29530 RepID=UPI000372FB14|nr:HD domain-containing protein [Cytophaga aurantiaca]
MINKKKVVNDPVWGFINIPTELLFEVIQHPYFQRLRRIRQLGLTEMVYPGAIHTRFHHALGAMHLMTEALKSLQSKGHAISPEEFEGAQLAILLHDIGHGPLSHALEYSLLSNIKHEELSKFIMESLNKEFDNKLSLAISIFTNTYHRTFLHQLVSSQLDMDRMDYLSRDSFFTGVSEGTIGADRLIKMLDLHNDELIVEEKGIYSIENFLTARRLMYWQVYLHKTTVSAENMIVSIIKRAKHLIRKNELSFKPPYLSVFLETEISFEQLIEKDELLSAFLKLDDIDLWYAIKQWSEENDYILVTICNMLLNRKLFSVQIQPDSFSPIQKEQYKKQLLDSMPISEEDLEYFLLLGTISNAAYLPEDAQIKVKMKNKEILDVAYASDLPNIQALSKIVTKHYICCPKNVYL